MSDKTDTHEFRTTLLLHGKTATGIEVPRAVVEAIGAGRKPPVKVTIAGHTYRSTIASRGERFLVGVSAENRAAAGIAAGDEVDVAIRLDTEPRVVELPEELETALAGEPEARRFYDGLTASQQGWFVSQVNSAKKPETRRKRVERAVEMLRDGRKR